MVGSRKDVHAWSSSLIDVVSQKQHTFFPDIHRSRKTLGTDKVTSAPAVIQDANDRAGSLPLRVILSRYFRKN